MVWKFVPGRPSTLRPEEDPGGLGRLDEPVEVGLDLRRQERRHDDPSLPGRRLRIGGDDLLLVGLDCLPPDLHDPVDQVLTS